MSDPYDKAVHGDLGGPDDGRYGPRTGTGLGLDTGDEPSPYPIPPQVDREFAIYAAQWDALEASLAPLYEALAANSAALTGLLRMPWTGDAAETTRTAVTPLKTAIDELLAVGQEGGLADLLNTAHATAADWRKKEQEFKNGRIIEIVFGTLGAALVLLPGAGALVVKAFPSIGTKIASALAFVTSRLPGAAAPAVGAAGAQGAGRAASAVAAGGTGATRAVVIETATIAGLELVIGQGFEAVYRTVISKYAGQDPNYLEGALFALGPPIGAALYLTRIWKPLNRLTTDHPYATDILGGAVGGIGGAGLGFAISGIDFESQFLVVIAAAGAAGGLGVAVGKVVSAFKAKSRDQKFREQLLSEIKREDLRAETDRLLGTEFTTYGSSFSGTQKDLKGPLKQAQGDLATAETKAAQMERGVTIHGQADDIAAAAARKRTDSDAALGRATDLEDQAFDARGGSAAALRAEALAQRRLAQRLHTDALVLDQRSGALRRTARQTNDGADTDAATDNLLAARAAVSDATLRRDAIDFADRNGTDALMAVVSKARRFGALAEAAFQVPISIGTRAYLRIGLAEWLGTNPSDKVSQEAIDQLRRDYPDLQLDETALAAAGL